MTHSGPCVCALPDAHPASAHGGRSACSVHSSGISLVRQCLEAVLVAFEAAGGCGALCLIFDSST
jgi:hypothetical protein